MLRQSHSRSGYLRPFIHDLDEHGSDILVKIIIYELESMNDLKARRTIKRDSEEHDLDSKFTRLDSPNYYSRFGAHVAFCNEMDFHSLGLFIYVSFRISCLISFRNRKGREIFFLFKHLALGTGITLTIDWRY